MKCPIDNRIRPIYITYDNKRLMVIADGLGNAYKTYSEGYSAYGDKPLIENLINPNEYEFERGLSGMDY